MDVPTIAIMRESGILAKVAIMNIIIDTPSTMSIRLLFSGIMRNNEFERNLPSMIRPREKPVAPSVSPKCLDTIREPTIVPTAAEILLPETTALNMPIRAIAI